MDTLSETRRSLMPLLAANVSGAMAALHKDWREVATAVGAKERLGGLLHRLKGEASLLDVPWLSDVIETMEAVIRKLLAGGQLQAEDRTIYEAGLDILARWTRAPNDGDPRGNGTPPPESSDTASADVPTAIPTDRQGAGGVSGRRTPRTQVALRVDYDDPRQFVSDYLTDLGEGGLFLCTAVPFEVGEEISFSISFPRVFGPLAMRGVVRWRRTKPEAPDRLPGVGVEIMHEDPEAQRTLRELLARLQTSESDDGTSAPFSVLLVEDNPFAHKLFEHAVKRFHRAAEGSPPLKILGAADGREALEILGSHSVDLAIVDHFLPVVAGSEVVRRIRADARHRDIPVLVISVGGQGVREEVLAAGADLYIDKPVLLKQLMNTLRLLVQHQAGRRGSARQAAGTAMPQAMAQGGRS